MPASKKTIKFDDIPKTKDIGKTLTVNNMDAIIKTLKQQDIALQQMGSGSVLDKMLECLKAATAIIEAEKTSATDLLKSTIDRLEEARKADNKRTDDMISKMLTKIESNMKAVTDLAKSLPMHLPEQTHVHDVNVDAKVEPDPTKKEFKADIIRDNMDLSKTIIIRQVK